MEEKYDPKLKEAMAKIKAILTQYDIGATVNLVSKTHVEFLHSMPTWSAARIEGDGIRVRSKKEDYPSLDAQKEAAELTAHLIMSLRDTAVLNFKVMNQLTELLKEKWEIQHTPFHNITPHREH